ncbi:PaaX family transcriptional regulator C-terminal domain-containing protein, partial [Amaricoccus sp.]|uniref:PaaX family transcriptional regulator C-terminal domain-containing protein n=1 Tax=Amaricoccus sp. TaxID=1872485 RepID=UPI002621DD38
PGAPSLARLLDGLPISAAPFVVTLYGDVVAPRGGELWTGNIVETLGALGIAESRVRTALSRLVAAGRLEGAKEGRRSYYRLTPAAQQEFSSAARLIYAAPEPPPLGGWHLVLLPESGREAAAAALARLRFGLAAPQLALLPDRGTPLPPLPGLHFTAATEDPLPPSLAAAWPLADLAERMAGFVDRFDGLDPADLAGPEVLALRLALVHAFREIALRDPLLPPSLLPQDWPGPRARALFVRLYLACAPRSDALIAARWVSRAGPLRPDPARLRRRLADMTGRASPS